VLYASKLPIIQQLNILVTRIISFDLDSLFAEVAPKVMHVNSATAGLLGPGSYKKLQT